MSSARREVDEEGPVRRQRAVAADEIDGLAGVKICGCDHRGVPLVYHLPSGYLT